MKVSKLIERLKAFPPDEEVYFHCDFQNKSTDWDQPFFEVGSVIDMGRVVLFEDEGVASKEE